MLALACNIKQDAEQMSRSLVLISGYEVCSVPITRPPSSEQIQYNGSELLT